MTFGDAIKWNKRASLIYAVGIWSMIGTYGFFRYTGRIPDPPVQKPEEVEEPEDPYRVVYEAPHNKTVIVYRKDFVPFSTKVSNLIQWFNSKLGSGGSEE